MPYIPRTYFITGGLYLWTTFTHSPTCTPPSCFWQPPICFLYPWVHLGGFVVFPVFVLDFTNKSHHMALFFSVWFISHSTVPSWSIHVVPNGRIYSFLWMNNIPLLICTTVSLFIGRHLGCSHILVIVNNTNDVGAQISFQVSVFISFRQMSRSGIAGSYSYSIFNFLRRTSILFSIVVVQPRVHKGSFFLHVLTNTYFLFFS